jgi:hypothetical protein
MQPPTLEDEIAVQREWLRIAESWMGIWGDDEQSAFYAARAKRAEATRATLNRLLAAVPEGEDGA